MRIRKYQVGDTVWYADGAAEKLSGVVVEVLPRDRIPGYDEHYIIEVHTHIDNYLIIRSIYTVASAKDAPLALYVRE